MVGGLPSAESYTYDEANRLTVVDGVNYTWDDNGNLLNDGARSYAYDSANRLVNVDDLVNYSYNGLGDRLSQDVVGAGLTNTRWTSIQD
jgi:hypothetical protein